MGSVAWAAVAVAASIAWAAAPNADRRRDLSNRVFADLPLSAAGTAGNLLAPEQPFLETPGTLPYVSPEPVREALTGSSGNGLLTQQTATQPASATSDVPAVLAATSPTRPRSNVAPAASKSTQAVKPAAVTKSTSKGAAAVASKIDKPPRGAAQTAARAATKGADADVELLSALMLHMGGVKPTAIAPRPLPQQDCDSVVAKARQAVICITGTRQKLQPATESAPVR